MLRVHPVATGPDLEARLHRVEAELERSVDAAPPFDRPDVEVSGHRADGQPVVSELEGTDVVVTALEQQRRRLARRVASIQEES
jgi:hypothetical protein